MERRGEEGRRGARCCRQGQGSASCWESQPGDIITSEGSSAGAASAVSWALPVPRAACLLLHQSSAKPGEDSQSPQCLDISSLARASLSLPKQSFLLPLFPSLQGFLLQAKQNMGPFPIPAPLTSSHCTERGE